jgi:hypothetical protein
LFKRCRKDVYTRAQLPDITWVTFALPPVKAEGKINYFEEMQRGVSPGVVLPA